MPVKEKSHSGDVQLLARLGRPYDRHVMKANDRRVTRFDERESALKAGVYAKDNHVTGCS